MIGRFTQQDPALIEMRNRELIEAAMQHPQRLNPYAYVENNPVNRVDPTGEFDILGAALTFGPVIANFAASYLPFIPAIFDNPQGSLEAVLRTAPYSEEIIDAFEASSGRDFFTQEEFSSIEKALTRAGVALPFISGAMTRSISKSELAQKLIKALNDYKVNKIITQVENGAGQIKVASREEAIKVGMRFVGDNPRRLYGRETGLPIGWERGDGTSKFREPAPKSYAGGNEGAN